VRIATGGKRSVIGADRPGSTRSGSKNVSATLTMVNSVAMTALNTKPARGPAISLVLSMCRAGGAGRATLPTPCTGG
jgi:hypothetical protein